MSRNHRCALWAFAFILAVAPHATATPDARMVVQSGHVGRVVSLSFSPDGAHLLTGGQDGFARLWELRTGRLLRTFGPLSAGLSRASSVMDREIILARFQSGGRIFLASRKATAIYELSTGKRLCAPPHYGGAPVVDPKARVILRPDRYGSQLMDISSCGKPKQFFQAKDHPLYRRKLSGGTYRFGPRGRTLWKLTLEKLVTLDIKTGAELQRVSVGAKRLELYDLHPLRPALAWRKLHRTKVAIAGLSNKPVELKRKTGKNAGMTHRRVDGLAFDAKGERVATTGVELLEWVKMPNGLNAEQVSGGDVALWDARTGVLLRTFAKEPHERFSTLGFSRDGSRLAAAGADGGIVWWDLATGVRSGRIPGATRKDGTVQSYDGGRRAVTAGDSVTLWDLVRAQPVRRLRVPGDARALAAAIGPRQHVAAVDTRGRVHLWRHDGALVHTFRFSEKGDDYTCGAYPDNDAGVGFDSKGELLVAGVCGHRAVWRISNRERLKVGDSRGNGHPLVFTAADKAVFRSHYGTGGLIDLAALREGRPAPYNMRYKHTKLLSMDGAGRRYLDAGDSSPYSLTTGILGESKTLERLKYHTAPPMKTAVTRTGNLGAVSTTAGEVHIVQLSPLKILRTIRLSGIARDLSFSADGKRLLAMGTDGLMRLLDPNAGKLLYTAMSDASESLAWIADGHYLGTPRAQRTWVHIVKGGQTFAIDQFFDQFYDPERVRAMGLGKAMDRAGLTLPKLSAPPQVTIVAPTAGRSKVAEVEVRVKVKDRGGGVRRVFLHQNHKLVAQTQRGLRKASAARTSVFKVLLARGKNVIEVFAEGNDGARSEGAIVTLALEGPIPKARLHIFSIGISKYANPKYSLNFGRKDAQAVVAALGKRAKAIFAGVRTHTLFDRDATRARIRAKFQEVQKEARPEDVFVLFFAGHGVMSEGNAVEAPRFYLVPHDVKRLYGNDSGLAERGISADELKRWLGDVKAQKQLVLIDACEAGGALQAFAFRGAAEEKAMYQLARSVGVVLLAATGSAQFASEVGALGHGVFTYALLKALDGEADQGRDGKVTVKEIEAFVNDRVPELTQKHRGTPQYPHSFSLGQDFPVAVSRSRPTR